MKKEQCIICKKQFYLIDLYEYRGAIACDGCFQEAQDKKDFERQEIIAKSRHKTDRFRGLDLSDTQIGKANREILKADIEIARKE